MNSDDADDADDPDTVPFLGMGSEQVPSSSHVRNESTGSICFVPL